jgi:hypothetical protein
LAEEAELVSAEALAEEAGLVAAEAAVAVVAVAAVAVAVVADPVLQASLTIRRHSASRTRCSSPNLRPLYKHRSFRSKHHEKPLFHFGKAVDARSQPAATEER